MVSYNIDKASTLYEAMVYDTTVVPGTTVPSTNYLKSKIEYKYLNNHNSQWKSTIVKKQVWFCSPKTQFNCFKKLTKNT